MNSVGKLETTIAGWYKGLPHLPAEVRKWLSENVWWIALVGVIFGAFSILGMLFFSLLAGAALTAIAGGLGAIAGITIFLSVLFTVLLGAVCLVLSAMAINPLKAMQKKGWTLLFWVLLIEAAATVLTNLLSATFLGLIWGLLWVAVGGYFLFELRSYFDGKDATGRKKVEATQK